MRYATPAGSRAALEAHLGASERAAPAAWVLKGGFALELRRGGLARATRDVDIDWSTSLDEATALVEAAALDLADDFEFAITRVGAADIGAGGGIRFRADAYLGGRLFEPLLIDVGGAGTVAPADELTAPDLLDFAEIEPARIRAIPLEQHIAEKLHAYTRRYGDDQPSSRAKDLIDIILMSELAPLGFDDLWQGTHERIRRTPDT